MRQLRALTNLKDDGHCFACGEKNKQGLNLKFEIDENNRIHTEFTPQKQHQGFKDVVHGGIIGLVLDEVMVNLPWKMGKNVVSAEINIRLKKMAKVGERLIFTAWIEKEDKRVIYTASDAKKDNGEIIASATAKCVRL